MPEKNEPFRFLKSEDEKKAKYTKTYTGKRPYKTRKQMRYSVMPDEAPALVQAQVNEGWSLPVSCSKAGYNFERVLTWSRRYEAMRQVVENHPRSIAKNIKVKFEGDK